MRAGRSAVYEQRLDYSLKYARTVTQKPEDEEP